MNSVTKIPPNDLPRLRDTITRPISAVPTLAPETVALFSAIESAEHEQFNAEAVYADFAGIRRSQ